MAFLEVFRSRRMAVLCLLGFASGTPLYLTGQLLQAWQTSEGASVEAISALAIVGFFGYSLKWLWAPLLDRYSLPFLGRRRGWALVSQLGLVVVIIAMGLTDPRGQPVLLAVLASSVAVLSATQDVVLDAYSVDVLSPEERAAGSAIYMIGYRIAMLLTGTLGLFLGEWVPWSVIYCGIGSLMLVGVVATLMAEEPVASPPKSFLQAYYLPISDLARRFGWKGFVAIVVFSAIYKFGDYFQQTLLITFFVRGLHFNFAEIALVYKLVAFAAIFIGGFAGGAMVAKYGLRRTLIIFGILDGVTSLLYSLAALSGRDFEMFTISVFVHLLTAQMGTAAFLAFLYSMCSKQVSATQMAIFTSLSSIGQRIFGVFAGDVVATFDGHGFGQLVAHKATIDTLVRSSFHATRYDPPTWGAIMDGTYYPIREGLYRSFLTVQTQPTDAMVTGYNWPWFFAVTAMMAIPGILLAGFVAKYAALKPPELAEAKVV